MKTSYKFILALFILPIAFSCNSDREAWEQAKVSNTVYPVDSLVKFEYNTTLGDTERVWINKSYSDYPYKKFCKSSIKVTFDINEPIINESLPNDSLVIAKLLVKEFRLKGVTHLVGQVCNSKNVIVYLHVEEGTNPISSLFEFEVPNVGKIETDEEWYSYKQLLNRVKYKNQYFPG